MERGGEEEGMGEEGGDGERESKGRGGGVVRSRWSVSASATLERVSGFEWLEWEGV